MNSPYQVPAEMRDLAEKSVQQARKAFEGFMGAVQQGAGKVDEVTNSTSMGVKDMSVKAATYAETNVKAAFDLAEKMVKAKDFQEVMALQADFVKAQMTNFQAQARELGEAVQTSAAPKKK